MSHVVVMVTTSYPRFPGDSVGTFMEPIAKSVAARGHEVHIVAPWHPLVSRSAPEDGVTFHFYKYAPVESLNVFGYAAAMRADVSLRGAAYAAAPLALAAGWRAARTVARKHGATIMHGHWVIPGGVLAAAAMPALPLVVSLHGSDVYVAETVGPARRAARAVSCSPGSTSPAVRHGRSSAGLASSRHAAAISGGARWRWARIRHASSWFPTGSMSTVSVLMLSGARASVNGWEPLRAPW